MDGDALYPIGEAARRTGLTVKAIRFYSDRGIVTPAGRNPAGYRLYDGHALARLGLIRTLRDLGLSLATIRQVLDRELSLPEVAATHAEALAVQIRSLRLRRAILMAVASRQQTPEEMSLMNMLAKLSEGERRRLTGEFLEAVFGGLDVRPGLAGARRSMTPELPGDARAEQTEAWAELAELSQDPDFRACIRRLAEDEAAEHSRSGASGPRRDLIASACDLAGPALEAGIDPASPQADGIAGALTAHYAQVCGRPDSTELRRRLVTRLETANDPRRQRYVQLLAVINDWPPPVDLAPALGWSIKAIRARHP